MTMHGIVVLNKSVGMTSRQAIDRVKRIVRPAKVGHAGTLDPLASGVLVVCVGSATRLIDYVQQMPKRYTGTFLLGRESPTEDLEGEVIELENPPVPSREELEQVATQFVGRIEQRPPIYSALKVAGRRAYDLARKGRDVELAPRPVDVHRVDVVRYDYPEIVLDIECGAGTYVRSLGRDLGEALGSAAVMSALVRTAIGGFHLDDACDPDSLTAETLGQSLLPSQLAVESLPCLTLSEGEAAQIANGIFIARDFAGSEEFAGIDATGRLIAILTPRGAGTLGARLNLVLD